MSSHDPSESRPESDPSPLADDLGLSDDEFPWAPETARRDEPVAPPGGGHEEADEGGLARIDDMLSSALDEQVREQRLLNDALTALRSGLTRVTEDLSVLVRDLPSTLEHLRVRMDVVETSVGQLLAAGLADELSSRNQAFDAMRAAIGGVERTLAGIEQQVRSLPGPEQIEEVSGEMESLWRRIEERVRATQDGIGAVERALMQRLGPESTIAERLETLERSLARRLGTEGSVVERIEDIEGSIDERLDSIDQSSDERVRGLERRLGERLTGLEEATDGRLGASERALQEMLQAVEAAVGDALLSAQESVTDALGGVQNLVDERLAQFEGGVAERLEAIEQAVGERLGATEEITGERLASVENALVERLGSWEELVGDRTTSLEEALSERLQAVESAVDARLGTAIESLDGRLEEFEVIVGDRLLRTEEASAETSRSARELVEQLAGFQATIIAYLRARDRILEEERARALVDLIDEALAGLGTRQRQKVAVGLRSTVERRRDRRDAERYRTEAGAPGPAVDERDIDGAVADLRSTAGLSEEPAPVRREPRREGDRSTLSAILDDEETERDLVETLAMPHAPAFDEDDADEDDAAPRDEELPPAPKRATKKKPPAKKTAARATPSRSRGGATQKKAAAKPASAKRVAKKKASPAGKKPSRGRAKPPARPSGGGA